jgi:hypothetical protein
MLVLNICTIYCIYNRVDLAVTSETGAQAPSLPLSWQCGVFPNFYSHERKEQVILEVKDNLSLFFKKIDPWISSAGGVFNFVKTSSRL